MKRVGRIQYLVLIMLAACIPAPLSGDSSAWKPHSPWIGKWLAEPACSPPCWEGISPGKSSLTDAEVALEAFGGTELTQRGADHRSWLINGLDTVYVRAEAETVSEIGLGLNSANSIPLAVFVSNFGQPSAVQILRCLDGICEVRFIYRDYSMLAASIIPNPGGGNAVQVAPEATVREIVFFDSRLGLPGIGPADGSIEVPWRGFGDYP